MDTINWMEAMQKQDKRVIGRLITHIENQEVHTEEILKKIFSLTGRAFVVGITGPPGVGKSTLVDCFISYLRSLKMTVAVVAIDPSSPLTGGAILGDRVRMTNHALDNGVFIRSMGTRGKQGGIAAHTREVVHVLDAAGYDVVFVETVGVGQVELEVMNLVDSIMLILHPQSGDMVQVLKAGIMEISDVFVINKADLKGADRLGRQIHDMIELVKKSDTWHPSVLKVIAKNNEGIEELWKQLQSHKTYLKESGDWIQGRKENLRQEVCRMITTHIQKHIDSITYQKAFLDDMQKVALRRMNPQEISHKWIQQILREEFIHAKGE